jgi:P27 family predicted phage terminase small subunit
MNFQGGGIMARQRQPIHLLQEKGKKHLTKEEVESREATEVDAPVDKIVAPSFLLKRQKEKFYELSEQLVALHIFSNLDCDTLARYLVAEDGYLQATKIVKKYMKKYDFLDSLEKAVRIQNNYFKQCRAAAADLGLTITSRCRLVIPQKKEKEPESKWASWTDAG